MAESEKREDFSEVEVFQPGGQELVPAPQGQTGLVSIEQSRAVAEVQAAMFIARANPRDINQAHLKVIQACKRKKLAEQAQFAFPRGGKLIKGKTIRLMEVVAACYGNTQYGFLELSRSLGVSDVMAFAWDLETNTKVTRQFQVRHIRDTKEGPKNLKAERDIYEHIASQAQRRVRACIEEIVPRDLSDAAAEQCEQTLLSGDNEPFEDRIKKMVVVFSELGVTQTMIEARLGHKLTALVPTQLVDLLQIFRSIRDGVADRWEFFDKEPTLDGKESKPETEPATSLYEEAKRPRKRGYAKWVRDNIERIKVAPEDDQKKIRDRWIKFYPDDLYPLDATPEGKKPGETSTPKDQENGEEWVGLYHGCPDMEGNPIAKAKCNPNNPEHCPKLEGCPSPFKPGEVLA